MKIYRDSLYRERLFIHNYGKYLRGLTSKEIKEYLKERSKVNKLGNLFKQFVKIAGVNTGALELEYDKNGKKMVICLMFREDVLRFANQLFSKIPTGWSDNYSL